MRRSTASNVGPAVILALCLGVTTSVSADAGWSVSHWLDGFGPAVTGSGTLRQETRDITSFDAVQISDSTDVEILIGAPASLMVEADDNILPLIATQVRSGTLIVKSTGSYRSHHGPKVVLTTPTLGKLALDGSGDVKLSRLSGKELTLSISGSGDIRAEGEVEHVDLRIDGSGDADLRSLQAHSASVSINGSGDGNLSVSDSLDAVVNGSGDITYSGNPSKVSTRVHGSGDIARR